MSTPAFGMVERAVKQILIAADDRLTDETVGGDPAYEVGMPHFVWISLIPGGSATRLEGEWYVDIDVLAPTYATAMRLALDIEALLVGRAHRAPEMRLDNVYVNTGAAERPWEDENTARVGGTYVFTARRSG